MKRLGEILIDRGAIAVSELHTGLEACRRSGGRLGTQLLKFGFVTERTLLDALSEQYGVPSVTSRMLAKAPKELRTLLSAALARRLQALPFGRTGSGLRVAMTNPRDPARVEEISQIVGSAVEPYVATENAILAAIAELGREVVADDRASAAAEPVSRPSSVDWEQLWVPPLLEPDRLLRVPHRRPSAKSPHTVATFPGLSAIVEGESFEPDREVDSDTFRRRVAEVRHRDEVGSLLLRFAANYFGRVCLFAVYRGVVIGWMARGHGVAVDDIQSFSTPLDKPSLFRDLATEADRYIGPIPPGAENDNLVRVMGDPKPAAVLMLPIRVKDHTVAYLLGDNLAEETVAVPADDLVSAVQKAGAAFETLIIRKKIMS
jgi:nitroreductase